MTEAAISKSDNVFLTSSIPLIFAKTALPISTVMLVNGLHTVVDAYFLGTYVSTQALTAVTLMFPLFMILVALYTLVSNGFASIYARALGGRNHRSARKIFDSTIFLALVVSVLLILSFLALGYLMALLLTNGSHELAELGYIYMLILIAGSPLGFMQAINSDRLRSEGKLKIITAIALSAAFFNIFFDWLYVVEFGWGVPGSAYGTLTAQLLSLIGLLAYYTSENGKLTALSWRPVRFKWGSIIALGIPQSLGYIGLSLVTSVTLFSIWLWVGDSYEVTAGAFGIINRMMTFSFLPLLGFSMALQSIAGNNFGAQEYARSTQTLKVAIFMSLIYCVSIQAIYYLQSDQLGAIFIDDPATIAEISRILPIVTVVFFLAGPLIMVGTFYQAIGDAARAGILMLSETYLFAIPLTLLLPFAMGEPGIWYARILASTLLLCLTLFVVVTHKRTLTLTTAAAE